jgi:hypothetical protein
MTNFLRVKNVINGDLDENNVSSSSNLIMSSMTLSDNINTPLIQPVGSVSFQLSQGTSFSVMDGYNANFSIDNTGFVEATNFLTLPIGSIIQFDSSWIDNNTIPGWYKCDGSNGTVDLRNRFVRGSTTAGSTGGTNDAPLIEHTHTSSVSAESAAHTHTLNTPSSSDNLNHQHGINAIGGSPTPQNGSGPVGSYAQGGGNAYVSTAYSWNHTHTLSGDSLSDNSATHTHSISIANTGLASGSNMPAFYTLIFIQRIS